MRLKKWLGMVVAALAVAVTIGVVESPVKKIAGMNVQTTAVAHADFTTCTDVLDAVDYWGAVLIYWEPIETDNGTSVFFVYVVEWGTDSYEGTCQ